MKLFTCFVIGLTMGLFIMYFILEKKYETIIARQQFEPSSTMDHAMHAMSQNLEGKIGEEFDRAFLSDMIVHHEGAVDMAEKARKNAQHEEIKKMAEGIIKVQTQEIDLMREWQKNWNYHVN